MACRWLRTPLWPSVKRGYWQSPAAFSSSTRLFASEAASAPQPGPSQSQDSEAALASSSQSPQTHGQVRNLLEQRPQVKKRPHRERGPNPGLGARVPKAPSPELSQQVWLPNLKIVLCRNGPAHQDDPYTATFRVPMALSKPDIVSFLTQVYGLEITGIRTLIYRGEVIKMPHPGYTSRKGPFRSPGYKKAIVQMTKPFWYPEAPSKQWLEDTYSTETQKQAIQRRQASMGNAERPGFDRRELKFRGADPSAYGLGSRASRVLKNQQKERQEREADVNAIGRSRAQELAAKVRRAAEQQQQQQSSEHVKPSS